MPPRNYSRDIWDYLVDMPYMPTRSDRDDLLRVANLNRSLMKRVHLWDYFFRIRPWEVGKPQLHEIAELQSQMEMQIESACSRAGRIKRIAVFLVPIGMLISAIGLFGSLSYALLIGAVLSVIGVVLYLGVRRNLQIKNAQTTIEFSRKINALQKMVESLRHQIPKPPDDLQVHKWLQEDIEELLTQRALEQTSLGNRVIELQDCHNPLFVLGPAELQNLDSIPKPLLSPPQANKPKHFQARRFVTLPDGTFADFYGVYYVEFIIVANDMLGNYGCFFDFITGQTIGEHTAIFFYKAVVKIDTRHEYREIKIGSSSFSIENAPTFGMSLTSSERIEVTFPNREYFSIISKLEGGPAKFDPTNWARNPEVAADNAVKALHKRLYMHQALSGESDALSGDDK